jgi:hypothetical protein
MLLAEDGMSTAGLVISIAWVVILVVFMAVAVRWQFRLFRDVQRTMTRIADAIERIADRAQP